jgi:hypothetical protein
MNWDSSRTFGEVKTLSVSAQSYSFDSFDYFLFDYFRYGILGSPERANSGRAA